MIYRYIYNIILYVESLNICDDFSWDLRVIIENDDDDDNKRVGVIPTCPYQVIRGPISFVFIFPTEK